MKITNIVSGLIFGLFLSGGLTGTVFASDFNNKDDSQQDRTVNSSSQPSTDAAMYPSAPQM